MVNLKLAAVVIASLAVGTAVAYSATNTNANPSRRTFINTAITTAASSAAVIGSSNSIASAADNDDPYSDFTTTESGLRYKVMKEGAPDGEPPVPGAMVNAHYTGWLGGFDSTQKFDSSRDRNRPFRFAVGKGQVIRGWDESFSSMTVGERRQIIIPPRLGYGDRGAGGVIPGGATLYFDVELLSIGK